MKKPKVNDLVQDMDETRKVHSAAKKSKSIKITINIDASSLSQLRKLSDQTGVPYQRLLNKFLKEGLDNQTDSMDMEARMKKLETELKRLKRRIAA